MVIRIIRRQGRSRQVCEGYISTKAQTFERENVKCTDLAVEVRERGWQENVRPVERGGRVFGAKSVTSLLLEFGG